MMVSRQLLALTVIAALAAGCRQHRDSSPSTASDSLFYQPHGEFDEPGALRIGDRGQGKGGGFSVSVGKDFGKPEMAEVYHRLVALEASGEFKQFSCGEEVPHFGFDLTMHEEGELQERLVMLGYVPYPAPWGPDRCISQGFNYVVARTFAQVDSGPSVEYGYKNPSSGEQYPAKDPGERHSRWWPTCHCEMSRTDPEWVTSGPVETSLGANAH